MVEYDDENNALTLGDDDSLKVGDYELKYSSEDDEWQAEYARPIGGKNGLHGTIDSGIEYATPSRFGSHSAKTGDGFIRFSGYDMGGLSQFSVSVWMRADRISSAIPAHGGLNDGGDSELLLLRQNGDDVFCISFGEDDEAYLYVESVNDETSVTTTTSPISVDTWHHIVGVYDGTSGGTLYVDGTEVGSFSLTGEFYQNVGEKTLGGAEISNDTFDGLVDDFRVYETALTSAQVTDLYNGVDVTDSLEIHYEFEYPETPELAIDSTGDSFPRNTVPRATNESLVPQGLAESVSAGEALADDGNTYSSVQTAVDNATGWVFVGPGTFNEAVNISTAGLTLEGCGDGTHIDARGEASIGISLNADNVTVRGISVSTDSTATQNSNHCISDVGSAVSNATIQNVTIRESNKTGIRLPTSDDYVVTSCDISSTAGAGIRGGASGIVSDCTTSGTNKGIVVQGDDSIVTSCIIDTPGDDGIQVNSGNDSIVIGNRVVNPAVYGVEVFGDGCIVANNRISDAGTGAIADNGTGTVLDDNKTGPAN